VARQLLNDVDLHVIVYDVYGKGFMKTCKVSPDAYIQMALQLAYHRVSDVIAIVKQSVCISIRIYCKSLRFV